MLVFKTLVYSHEVKANNDFGFTMNNVLAQVINLIKTLFKIIIHDKHSNKLFTATFAGHHVEHIRPPESFC